MWKKLQSVFKGVTECIQDSSVLGELGSTCMSSFIIAQSLFVAISNAGLDMY